MKIKVFSVLVVLVMILSACQAAPSVPEAPAIIPVSVSEAQELQKGVPFRFVGNNIAHPVAKLMRQGFFDACKDLQVLCEDAGVPGTDEATYIESANLAISLGSSGVVGTGYSQYFEVDKATINAGIPLVLVHNPNIPKESVPGLLGWAATTPLVYGASAADAMKAKTNCGSPVAVTQSSLNDTENAASKGFIDQYHAICPDATILETQQEGLDPVEGFSKVAPIILANPDLKGAFGTTGYSIVNWSKALQQSGKAKGEVIVIGMDALPENIAMVEAGDAYMLVNQPLYTECYRAVEILVAHLLGHPFEYANPMAAPLIDKEHLGDLPK